MKNIVVIGGGFAGLWNAASAARVADALDQRVAITLVNRDDQHSIRVRNYEDDLAATLVPLRPVLDPIGVALVVGEATGIDTEGHTVRVGTSGQTKASPYNKLILASGSHLARPPLPGLAEWSFDVDTVAAASRLKGAYRRPWRGFGGPSHWAHATPNGWPRDGGL